MAGVLAELSDTAGQRCTTDPVEQIGVDRARRAVDQADIVLVVVDASEALTDEDAALLRAADARTLVCLNKTDLAPVVTAADLRAADGRGGRGGFCEHGRGHGRASEGAQRRLSQNFSEDNLTVERHIRLAQEASEALQSSLDALEGGYPLDVVSLDLKRALSLLSEITAQNATETLIDQIFSTFCVGK